MTARANLIAGMSAVGPEVHQCGVGQVAVFMREAPIADRINEDSALILELGDAEALLAVADGASGHPSGDLASRTLVKSIQERVTDSDSADVPLRELVMQGVEAGHHAILNGNSGGATTLVVALIDGTTVQTLHVGDSFALVVGQRGRIKMQSVPHSPTGYAVEAGQISDRQALSHPERHYVFNLVGSKGMRIEVGPRVELARHDTLLLASDGLSDNLTPAQYIEYVRKGDWKAQLEQLAKAVSEKMKPKDGATEAVPDDLTVLLYRRTQ